MELILNDNVENLGAIGELVKVKPGYARNFLIPRGLAVVATKANQSAIKHHMRSLEKKKAELLSEAKKRSSVIEKVSVTVSKQVGENEKIFGSVTTAELEVLLKAEGLEISRKDIRLEEEIKKVGVYKASVKLHPEVVATFKVWVVAQ